MSFDPKIRNSPQPLRLPQAKSTTAEKPAVSAPREKESSLGHAVDSSFEPSTPRGQKYAEGRAVRGGVADNSGLRRKRGGVADDSVGRAVQGEVADNSGLRLKRGGVADDSIGRAVIARSTVKGGIKPKKGVPDDSIGRTIRKKGVPDDSIGDSVRDSLVGPVDNPQYLKARDALYAQLESPSYLASAGRSAVGDLVRAKVLQSSVFHKLPTAQQASLGNVMSHLDDVGLRRLGALVEQAPEVLMDKDSAGKTLISNLEKLATQPLNSMLAGGTSTQELLNSALLDVTNPNRIDQGTAPTCTVTSMQFELVADNPAEYLRLLTGLAGPSGAATMKGGSDLVLGRGDADARARDDRPVSQAIFQSAAMEYGNGKSADFDPIAGKSTDASTGKTYAGLGPSQQTMVLRQLFGINYRTDQFYSESEGAKALQALQGFDASSSVNRPIILDIDQGAINHAVTLEKVDGGRVFFRDPYGVLRSIPDEMFPKYVVAMHRPADMLG